MLPFIRVRDAMFTTAGFNVHATESAPDGRWKGRNFNFVVNNAEGKMMRLEPMISDADPSAGEIFVHLKPYRGDPVQAAAAVLAMCEHLGGARKGNRKARESMGALAALIVRGEFPYAEEKDRLGLLAALYGRGRVLDELNRRGTTVGLNQPLAEMMAEAFVST